LLRTAMQDRLHQPYRAEMCALLPLLLPLAGSAGILGVALSGAGPSVLLIVDGAEALEAAREAVCTAVTAQAEVRILAIEFEPCGASRAFFEA
jgi:homoserine kinase